MAAYLPLESRLQLRVNIGSNESEDPILRSINFSGVSSDVEAEKVATISTVLESLLEYPVAETRKVDTDVVE
ncbi:MAG: DUF1659 domain-containing protein [Aminobacterium sp.]